MNIKLGDYITIMDDDNVIRLIGIVKEEISENYFDCYIAWDVSNDKVAVVKVRNNGRLLLSNEAEKKMLLERLVHYYGYVKQ